MDRLIRCGSMIGDRTLELFYYEFAGLRNKGFRLFCLESHTIGEVIDSVFPGVRPRSISPSSRRISSRYKGTRVVFRSSSLAMSKIFYMASWGKVWLPAFLFFIALSWLMTSIVRLGWMYSAKGLPLSHFVDRYLYWLITGRDHDRLANLVGIDSAISDSTYCVSRSVVDRVDALQQKMRRLSMRVAPTLSTFSKDLESGYISDPSRVVTMILRTSHYLQDPMSTRSVLVEPYLELAIKLKEWGYHPVFAGSYSDFDRLSIASKAIHLDELGLPNGYDEVALVRDSCLFVCNASGPSALAYLFGVNTMNVDHPFTISYDWFAPRSFYAPKYLYSESLHRYLTPVEIAQLPLLDHLGDAQLPAFFHSHRIELHCLTSRHLIELVFDALEAKFQEPKRRQELVDVDCSLRKAFVKTINQCSVTEKMMSYFKFMMQGAQGLPAPSYAQSMEIPWQPK